MIFLQVGQCGLQVGQSLFDQIDKENTSVEHAAYPLNKFRQVIVDTERKTWASRQRSKPSLLPAPRYVDYGRSGRGNNWAYGYSETSRVDVVLEACRREMEEDGHGGGFMILHSVAGGTGSGLGSRLAEELRDSYPRAYMMNCAVAPFCSGETTLQHYNALLSLGWMNRHSDCIALFSNDAIMNCLQRQRGLLAAHAAKSDKVTLTDLNEYIAYCLSGMLLPTTPIQKTNGGFEYTHKPVPFNGWDIIQNLTPIPTCKLLSITSSALVYNAATHRNSATVDMEWNDLNTAMLRNMPSVPVGWKRRCISARLLARGVQGPEFWNRLDGLEAKLSERVGIMRGLMALDVQSSWLYALNMKSSKRSMTLLHNDNANVPYIETVLKKARAMYDAGAFIHHYKRYAGDDMPFMFGECFEMLADVVDAYDNFCST